MGLAHQALQLAPARDVPEANGAIETAREQPTTVGRQGEGIDRPSVALEPPQFPASGEVPEVDGAVEGPRSAIDDLLAATGRVEAPPIGIGDDTLDVAQVARQSHH